MPSKRMVPEQEIAELSGNMVRRLALKDAEIATLLDSRDVQKALAQRYWDDLQTARAEIAALKRENGNSFAIRCEQAEEIAALTEQRDRAMEAIPRSKWAAMFCAAQAPENPGPREPKAK